MLLLSGFKMKVILRKWLQIVLGCLVTASGLVILKHSDIVTGGTAGLSLSLSPLLGVPFPYMFALLNLPFFLFSYFYMGKAFTLKTILAIALLTVMSSVDQFLPEFAVPPLVGAIVGGVFIGTGIMTLFRNGASLGGATILSIYLHKKHGINPGASNFTFDFIVILSSFFAYSLTSGIISILSIAVTSALLALFKRNKKRNRHPASQPTSPAITN